MTDTEYASIIYCRAFSVDTDGGDAYTNGILETIYSLDVREQLALESYFRQGNTYKQTAVVLGGVSNETARRIVLKALLKLRHPSRLRNMSVKAIIKQKNKLLETAITEINELRDHIERLSAT